ncbi:hypothetical protein ACTFIR_001175 [Dictyostelium discoideum]
MVKSKSESVNSKKGGISNGFNKIEKSTPVVKIVNPFDRKVNKTKHVVLNRQVKGASGDLGQSRYNAIEKRKKTILVEMNQMNKSNKFIDARIGENDASMSEEDKMLARFQREKLRNKNLYNLNDNDQEELTHMGQSLGNSLGSNSMSLSESNDDYVASDDELDEVGKEFLSERQRFGGGDDDGNGERQDRHKSKKEIYQEIIEKSKIGKAERAKEKLKKEALTRDLDEEFNLIRGELILTNGNNSNSNNNLQDDAFLKFQAEQRSNEQKFASSSSNSTNDSTKKPKEAHDDFDELLYELQGESRAHATDRTKTKEEQMKEEMERLQQKEKERLERASGDYVELEADDNVKDSDKNLPRKVLDRLKAKDNKPKMLTADSLDDENEVLNINGVDTVFYNPQIDSDDDNNNNKDNSDNEDDQTDEQSSELETDDEDKSGDEDEEGDEDEGEDEEDSDLDLKDDEILSGQEEEEEEQEEKEKSSKKLKTNKKSKEEVNETIPFTFDTPKSIEELDEWLLNRTSEEKETILTRIGVCNHVSIKPQNKDKMKDYLPILYQRFINIAKPIKEDDQEESSNSVDWIELDVLSKYIFEISQDVPIVSGITSKDLINSCYKRICKKLEIQSKLNYWPNQQELLVIKLIGNVFPTSDFQHPVVTPTVEALNFFLSHCPIRNANDIISSLFTMNLLFFYLSPSKRYSPEISSLLISLLSTFINHNPPTIQTTSTTTATTTKSKNSKNSKTTTTTTTASNINSQWASISTNILIPTILLPLNYLKLSNQLNVIKKIEPTQLEFSNLSKSNLEINDELRINILNYLISFLEKYIKFYSESQFNESLPSLFTNILNLLNKLDTNTMNLKLIEKINSLKQLIDSINKEIINKRKPLILLTSKPQTLRQFNPRFNQVFSFFNKDPDAERNHTAKMKALIKKETKGALREIVKDNQFIQAEKFKKATEERKENEKKRKQIMSELQSEQQEHKSYKKMKDRLDGRI